MFVNPPTEMMTVTSTPLSRAVWLRFGAMLFLLLSLMMAGTMVCNSSAETLLSGQDVVEAPAYE